MESQMKPEHAPRIDPQDVRRKLQSGDDTLLVCAYDDPGKFRQYHLEGAIALDEFRSRESELSPQREIVFYCS